MKKYREFDNVLDECLERLLSRGENLEQCLQGFPEYADELRPLLETALAAKEASAIQPRSEFREKARYQFYSALREMERKRSRSFLSWSWQPRWAVVVATVLVLFMAGGGTVAAAAGSMPDEPFYGVKLAAERVQLALTPSRLGKAELYARLADKRVSEIIRMADEGKPEKVAQAAQRLDTYLAKVTDLASARKVAGMLATTPALDKAATLGEETLTAPRPPVAGEVPADGERQVGREKAGVEEGMAGEKSAREKTPSVQEVPSAREAPARDVEKEKVRVDQRARLKELLARYAAENPERLRALLKKVPASDWPALLEVIRLLEEGYEEALESIDEP